MTDAVDYAVGFGPLGEIAHAVLVRRTLDRIFDHRAEVIASLFGAAKEGGRHRPLPAASPTLFS